MSASFALFVHPLFEILHPPSRIGPREVCLGRPVSDVAHHPLRHPDKPVAWVDAAVGAHGEGVFHAVDVGADRPPAGEDASSEVVDVPYLDLVHILQVLVEEVDEELAVLLGIEGPLIGVVALQRWEGGMELEGEAVL